MSNALLLPVFVQVALTFVLLFSLAGIRVKASKADPSLTQRAAVDTTLYSEKIRQMSNCFDNQFQLPLLFYVAVGFAILTAVDGSFMIWMISLAWVFVTTRILHAIIHIGPNVVIPRFMVFLIGALSLIGMWGVLAVHLFRPLAIKGFLLNENRDLECQFHQCPPAPHSGMVRYGQTGCGGVAGDQMR